VMDQAIHHRDMEKTETKPRMTRIARMKDKMPSVEPRNTRNTRKNTDDRWVWTAWPRMTRMKGYADVGDGRDMVAP